MTATPPLERLRGALSQSYTIDRELGRGGMATVYLAQDTRHERMVALKVLHPELAASLGPERFLREIKVAARLNHPHILGLHESGEADGFLYYVMPYVEGESLRERLDREQLLPVDEAVHHARSIASALDYAHRQQIVHRDIKPENVMLYEGEAMVMDFGIAKAVSSVGPETLTQTGMMVGTPAYVSPEQAAGETNLDGRSDQYSLACMLYEMLSGERPFTGATAQAIMAKRFTETAKPIRAMRSTVPENVERAIVKAMSTDVTGRFRTTAMFGQALASTSLTTPSETETMPQQVVSSAKSIAVLPFTNMSADPENEYFTDGIADEIINALSKIQTLRVASRTASFALKGKNEEIAEIGRKLKVSTFLEGSVRKIGNRLRITTQLVNVADGYHLWSERYDREMEDVFAIQDDISQSIVKALRVILSEDEKKAIEKSRTENVKAYELYLRGRQFFELRRKSLEYARQMFKRATDADPGYALAYAGSADCSSLLYIYHDARESNLRQAETASLRALELEPELAEAHLSRAIAIWLNKRNFAEAAAEFEKAMRLDPKLFEAPFFYGRAAHSHGKFAEAVRLFERAAQLRPEDYQTPSFLAQAYRALGKEAEATIAIQRGLKLTEERIELNPDDARAYNLAGAILAGMGETDRALEYARRAAEIDPDDTVTLYNAACTYATLGRHEEAMSSLELALDKGYGHKEWLENDPDFAALRDTPRFKAILAAM
ncbi:MAG: protein kinase [Gemmatimonadota bacterium]|nr:protein kinase [Gemmatimonadota bacterium]